MRYVTTVTPPAAFVTDYGLQIERAKRVYFGELDGPRAVSDVHERIQGASRGGYRSVVLQDVVNTRGVPIDDEREKWRAAIESLAKLLAGDEDLGITAIAIDHARYPERRQAKETAFLREAVVEPLLQSIGDRCAVGMFGVPAFSPAVWTHAADYTRDVAWFYDEFDARASIVPGAWDSRAVAWVPMPGQWRPGRPPATAAEFVGVLDFIRRGGIRTVCLWGDHRSDERGNPIMTPRDWQDTLAGIAVVEGRRVEVPKWAPPSWLPPVEVQP